METECLVMTGPLMTDETERIRRYHQLTKHRLNHYAPGPGWMDWATQPDPFREFDGAKQIPLPLAADGVKTGYGALYEPGAAPPHDPDLRGIAVLFELAFGLSAWKAYGAHRWALRCNPSSGNLHPTEAYLVCPDVGDLAGGIYHYHSLSHRLERRAAGYGTEWNALFPSGGMIIGLSAIHWREAWKYGARAYRYCQHDAGHAIAAVRYAAAALGWHARLLDTCSDQDIATLLGLDREEDFGDAEPEAPDALLWIEGGSRPDGEPSVEINALIAAAGQAAWTGRANRLSTAHRDWPQVEEVARAARKPRTPPAGHGDTGPERTLPLQPPALEDNAAALIRRRRSAVAFDGRTAITAEQLYRMLDALLPRRGVPPWDALAWAPRIHPVLFVHRVTGLDPGLYALPRREETAARLRGAMRREFLWETPDGCPGHLPLRLLAPLDVRRIAATIACHQDIAGDSAFALGMLAEYDEALADGPWWYRQLHWEAGMLGHCLYLEAEAAGVRSTGIGCFFDDEMHGALGLDDTVFQTIYHFTVGGAVDDTRLQTLPPYAHLSGGR